MKIKLEHQLRSGGFCCINHGKITNSYSLSKIFNNKNVGGFCFKNDGEIKTCFSDCDVKKNKTNSFYYENSGTITNSFNNDDRQQTNFHENTDVNLCNFTTTTISDLKKHYNVELNNFWHYSGNSSNLLSLDLNTHVYDNLHLENSIDDEPVSIKTSKQLLTITNKIKKGDISAAYAHYILESDINLQGKPWIPLGNASFPFKGTFDGNGHKIINFKITDKKLIFAGFFGVIENAVILNLQVDGIVKCGKYSGGFAGLNKNGKIYSCSAISQVTGDGCCGGFIGENSGIIEGCYYNGKLKRGLSLCWLIPFPLVIVGLLLYLYISNPMKNKSVFNNVPVDPYSVKLQNSSIYTGSGNKASFKFYDNIYFVNGQSSFDFGNPDTTNQSMTIKIQITDEELIKKIGRTGRTQKEQKKLNSNKNYDPSNSRITISESGLVLPGYGLKKLVLNKLPDGSDLPDGTYSGIAYLNFFNYQTNEKSIIKSQVPILIFVKN